MNPLAFNLLSTVANNVKAVLITVAFLALSGYSAFKIHSLQKEKVEWMNKAALSSKTVEDQQGLFERQSQELKDVQAILDSKDPQIKELEGQLRTVNEQLDNATTVTLQLRKNLEGQAVASQSSQAGATDRVRVDFKKDLDWLVVSGYTLSNPAEAFVSVGQGKPLKLTVALSQDKEGAMHAYVTSSELSLEANILASAINPNLRDTKWFQRLGVSGSLAVGDGLLVGLGASLDIGRFSVGPEVFLGINSQVSKFYGATVIYRTFAR